MYTFSNPHKKKTTPTQPPIYMLQFLCFDHFDMMYKAWMTPTIFKGCDSLIVLASRLTKDIPSFPMTSKTIIHNIPFNSNVFTA